MARAHGSSSGAPVGLQVKMARRLGVSPGPVALYGPSDDHAFDRRHAVDVQRVDREHGGPQPLGPVRTPPASARKVATTSCGPAYPRPGAKTRLECRFRRTRVEPVHLVVARAADGRLQHGPAVDADFDVVLRLEPADVADAGLPQPQLDDVLGVQREVVSNRRPAARAGGQPADVLVLGEVETASGASRRRSERGSPTARALMRSAALTYRSMSSGDTPRMSAMLSNP